MIVDALEESLQTQQSDSSSVTMTLGSASMLSSPTYARFQVLSDQSDGGLLVRSDGPIGRSEEASDARTGTDRTYSRERDSLSKTNKTTRRLLRQQ
jgi:hypothetical protein